MKQEKTTIEIKITRGKKEAKTIIDVNDYETLKESYSSSSRIISELINVLIDSIDNISNSK